MIEKIKLHDFVEIEYTGKLTDGTVFDTTKEDVAKGNKLYNNQVKYKPAAICVGEKQLLPGLDINLVDKEVGIDYSITLKPEEAFGKRDIKNMRIVPMSTFIEHKLQPRPGLQIDVDGEMGIVTRVSGGRVIVNFNHPLAGREIVYDYKIVKKITDAKEQVELFLATSFRLPKEMLKVNIAENKANVEVPFTLPESFLDILSKKLVELTGLNEIKIIGKVEKLPEVKK